MLIITEHDGSRWVDYDDARAEILRLVSSIKRIRDGAAVSLNLPASGLALDYEKICRLAADVIGWENGVPASMLVDTIMATQVAKAETGGEKEGEVGE